MRPGASCVPVEASMADDLRGVIDEMKLLRIAIGGVNPDPQDTIQAYRDRLAAQQRARYRRICRGDPRDHRAGLGTRDLGGQRHELYPSRSFDRCRALADPAAIPTSAPASSIVLPSAYTAAKSR